MRVRVWMLAAILLPTVATLAAANGAWLKKVPEKERVRVNPYSGQSDAIAAGENVYRHNCAKCHGGDANGLHGRPSLRCTRIEDATDGDLAWMLKNGNPWKGMPSWDSLPEQQRWQAISYIRSLPPAAIGGPIANSVRK